jgi:hypothetical protein
LFATGGVGEVTVTLATPIPLNNANLLSTGQIGTVIVPLGVSGVEATGVVEDVDVVTPTGELISLMYPVGGSPSQGTQDYAYIGSWVWYNYYFTNQFTTNIVKNYEYSIKWYSSFQQYQSVSYSNYGTNYTIWDTIDDFTIESWIYVLDLPNSPYTFDLAIAVYADVFERIATGVNSSGQLYFERASTTYTYTGGTVPSNQWVHVAFSREGTTLRAFINGTQVGSTTVPSGALLPGPSRVSYGGSQDSDFDTPYDVRMDSIRIVNNISLYNANFTPPAYFTPYPYMIGGVLGVGGIGTVEFPEEEY